MSSPEYQDALARFHAIHREDPKTVTTDGRELPWSVYYHERLAHWVEVLAAEASEPLRLAARCQHLKRWAIPRSSYPMDRLGYRRWRRDLSRFHAQLAGTILRKSGYAEETIRRVQQLLLKERLKTDPEVQLFEDAICLTFLENEFVTFAGKHEPEKVISILRKTLRKMSETGRRKALVLKEKLPEASRSLVETAAQG